LVSSLSSELGNGKVMGTTTDPVFVVPPCGWERSAWFAVHILASDAVTSGIAPSYITIDLNLPLSITRPQFEQLQCVDEQLGIAGPVGLG
jgi:hydrogenase maturation factor